MDSTTGQLLYKQLIEIIDPKQETPQPAKTQNKERTHDIFEFESSDELNKDICMDYEEFIFAYGSLRYGSQQVKRRNDKEERLENSEREEGEENQRKKGNRNGRKKGRNRSKSFSSRRREEE